MAQTPAPGEFPTAHPALTKHAVAVVRVKWQGDPTYLLNVSEIRTDIWGAQFSPPVPGTVAEFYEEMTAGHHDLVNVTMPNPLSWWTVNSISAF